MRRAIGVAVAAPFAAALLVAAAACGSDGDGDGARVRPAAIRPAMAAVEEMLGGPQVYSEVNATPSEVNVFVVHEGQDLAYVVRGDDVEPPVGSDPYAGPTFGAADVAFDPAVLDRLVDELPDSEIVAFSVTPAAGGGVDYIATVRATAGELRVLLDAAGNLLSAA